MIERLPVVVGGDDLASSEPGRGTTVQIYLPALERRALTAVREPAGQARGLRGALGGKDLRECDPA